MKLPPDLQLPMIDTFIKYIEERTDPKEVRAWVKGCADKFVSIPDFAVEKHTNRELLALGWLLGCIYVKECSKGSESKYYQKLMGLMTAEKGTIQ